ncbi:MAG: MurR/RpiR family transcriptional regulator [Beijerinckiaceae bacterium]
MTPPPVARPKPRHEPTFRERIGAHSLLLTQGEKDLAALLLQSFPEVAFESTAEIGRRVGVSAATVTRFFAKLGYAGFHAFRAEAQGAVRSMQSSPVDRLNPKAGGGASAAATLKRGFELERGNLDATLAGIRESEWIALADRLLEPNGRIYVLGERKGFAVAYYLYIHLNLCLPNVTLLNFQGALTPDSLIRVSEDDLLIAIEGRRYVASTRRVARAFLRKGAEVALWTDSPLSPIYKDARFRVVLSTASPGPFDSYAAALALSNALANLLAEKLGRSLAKTLQEGEAVWREFHTFAQPGDGEE